VSAPAFAGVDWGTTRLRLWIFDEAGRVVAERRSDEGLLAARPDRFEGILESHLLDLGAPLTLPVVICGMAGARQGWIEAPYVTIPAAPEAIFDGSINVPGTGRDIRIVPGLAQRLESAPDVMRGEETQLAGAAAQLGHGRHVLCLPGTHSKWVRMEDRVVTAFQTVMTGELFSVLGTQSILSHSLDGHTDVDPEGDAFRRGCAQGSDGAGGIAAGLFRIRAGSLLQGLASRDAAAFLSGLLIGGEIAACRDRFDVEEEDPVVLIAAGSLGALYEAALAQAGIACEGLDADEAVRRGLAEAARRCGFLPEPGR
jgi:2-dehydro-3-deoxygalactonokinase